MSDTMQVASDGSREADARVQVIEKVGFVDGPRVIQLFVSSRTQPHLKSGDACVWLTPDEARDVARQLLARAGNGG
jgi:hypothetical protein